MFADSFQVEIQNYIRIQYLLNDLLVTSIFHRHNTAKYVDEQLRCMTSSVQQKINAQNINILRFSWLISSRCPASWRTFLEGRFITPLSCYSPKLLMRSSKCTTGQVAENSIVDNATDACSLRCIFATFLADSSTSLDHTSTSSSTIGKLDQKSSKSVGQFIVKSLTNLWNS